MAVTLALTLAASNFFYQAVFASPPNWGEAAERSFFQAVAVAIYAWWQGRWPL